MKPEDEERLQAIEDRANAATEGRWEAVNPPNQGPKRQTRCHEVRCVEGQNKGIVIGCRMYKSDAAFVAEAVSDIPWLIERLREAEAHLHGKGGEK